MIRVKRDRGIGWMTGEFFYVTEKQMKFEDLLDENYRWPCSFPFKFIMPVQMLDEVLALFPGEEYTRRPSKTGKYVSVTIRKNVSSSKEVIEIYNRIRAIEGVICL